MSLHTVSVDNDLMQQIDNDHTYEEYKRSDTCNGWERQIILRQA